MNHSITTLDGTTFDVLNPTPEMIVPETLATVLGRTCRFGGHCKPFYTVAQHSVLVCSLVPKELRLEALLHDAHEAYSGFGDVCSPVKLIDKQVASILRKIEDGIDRVVALRFGADVENFKHPEIVHADNVLLATEIRDLMPPVESWIVMSDPLPNTLEVWDIAKSVRVFLSTLYRYSNRNI